MQGGGEEEVHPLRYELRGMGHMPEDILFCVDADAEASVEMKLGTQGKGLCRLEAIKQAIILFVHSKLMANPHHRFAFASLRNSASWVSFLHYLLSLLLFGHVCRVWQPNQGVIRYQLQLGSLHCSFLLPETRNSGV